MASRRWAKPLAGRELFNLSQAKQFMQTLLHASTIKDLIDADKSSSLRGVFYKAKKHTVAGTKENTFDTQDESDPILEDLEVTLGGTRRAAHLRRQPAAIVGNITIVDKRDEINCQHMGSGGYAGRFHRRGPTSSTSKRAKLISFCTSKKTRSGTASTKTGFGNHTTAS